MASMTNQSPHLETRFPYIYDLPSWQRILLYLYSQNTFSAEIFTDPQREPLLKLLKIKESEHRCFNDILNRGFMDANFVRKEGSFEYYVHRLTPEGLKLAREIIQHQDALQQSKNQDKIQNGVFLLTLMLVFISAIELIIKLLEPKSIFVSILVVILFLAVMFMLVFKINSLTYLATDKGQKKIKILFFICMSFLILLALLSLKEFVLPVVGNNASSTTLPKECLPLFLKCPT